MIIVINKLIGCNIIKEIVVKVIERKILYDTFIMHSLIVGTPSCKFVFTLFDGQGPTKKLERLKGLH